MSVYTCVTAYACLYVCVCESALIADISCWVVVVYKSYIHNSVDLTIDLHAQVAILRLIMPEFYTFAHFANTTLESCFSSQDNTNLSFFLLNFHND